MLFGVVCVIPCLATLVQCRLVADGQTDRRTDGRTDAVCLHLSASAASSTGIIVANGHKFSAAASLSRSVDRSKTIFIRPTYISSAGCDPIGISSRSFIFCILNVLFLHFQLVMSPVPSFCYCGIFATMPVRVLCELWQW